MEQIAGSLYASSFAESRNRFRATLESIRQRWPGAALISHPLSAGEDLTIDWIEAAPNKHPHKLLFFTAGEHGIEAYVGTGMLQLFFSEYIPRLDPETTGLVLVHTINPWGMKHWRRVNAHNVDLNRNFLWGLENADHLYDETFNPQYRRLFALLNPQTPVGTPLANNLAFASSVLSSLISVGVSGLRQSALVGQYHTPRGVYYGGKNRQEETVVLMTLYRRHFSFYPQIVHLDMHTGYGPRYQMSLVNSYREPVDSADFARRYKYPLVVKANPEEFYSIRGDMIDYVYRLVAEEFPDKRLYSTSFEFGTFGDSTLAQLRSMRATILENQLHWNGARRGSDRAAVLEEFQELFAPSESRWKEKAIADSRQAFEGILKDQVYIP
jgi:hypothetical protein